MLRVVLDTNVLVAARRSLTGASNLLIRKCVSGELTALASVPLFIEYEAVLTREEHLASMGYSAAEATRFLDHLAGIVVPIKLHYLWRPQLIDVADEIVLETAINGGADCIVTFNARHFMPTRRFLIDVVPPAEAARRIA